MINYETILSTFDDKLTLMQWLQKVEEALEGAGLERVDITQVTPTTAVFKFTFADGTSVTTPSITLPRGPKGDTGATGATGATGNGIASITKTGTSGLIDTYTILYTNGSTDTFTVTNGAQGEAGADGADGVGVSNVAIASTGALMVTLTNGSDVNAGQVYEILNLSGTSGTLTTAQLALIKHENTLIHISGKDYHLQFISGSGLGTYKYQGNGVNILTLDTEVGTITINGSTGAWTFNTGSIPYLVDVDRLSSDVEGTPATSGKVLTADGDGGVAWDTVGGGSLYLHTIRIWKANTANVFINVVSTKQTRFTETEMKTLLGRFPTPASNNSMLLVNGEINVANAKPVYVWLSGSTYYVYYTMNDGTVNSTFSSINFTSPTILTETGVELL